MPLDNITKAAIKHLQEKHQAHTVILYGSRARGDASATSDIDIACFTDTPSATTDSGTFRDSYLDAWIYPTTAIDNITEMDNITEEFLKLNSGLCVIDERGLGAKLLERVNHTIAAGRPPLSPDKKAHLIQWIEKMLNRADHNDVEGNYRRAWLQFSLLESYFDLRGQWYFGSKHSLSWLEKNDKAAFELFSCAYASPRNMERLKLLAEHIIRV